MTAPAPIAVLGGGAWGTALAIALSRDGAPIRLWARDACHRAAMRAERRNRKKLDGFAFPPSLEVADDVAAAIADASVVLAATPAAALATTAAAIARERADRAGLALVSCAKGLDPETGARCSERLAAGCPGASAAALSGPSFAKDLAAGLPTAAVLAMEDLDEAGAVAAVLSRKRFRLYPSDDPVGVEMGGALKNVLAIAAGVAWGAGLGENARAALITRGLAELARLVEACGGQRETLMGLAGMGDLILSATSLSSRNAAFGHALGRGLSADEAARATGLSEGRRSAPAVVALARAKEIDAPVANAVAAVLDGSLDVAGALEALLGRPPPIRE